jgi:hypothetical protein
MEKMEIRNFDEKMSYLEQYNKAKKEFENDTDKTQYKINKIELLKYKAFEEGVIDRLNEAKTYEQEADMISDLKRREEREPSLILQQITNECPIPTFENIEYVLNSVKDENVDNNEYFYSCFKFIVDNDLVDEVIKAFPTLKYLFPKFCLGHCNECVRKKALYYLRYSCERGSKPTTQTVMIAAEYNCLDCLEYLFNIKCPYTKMAGIKAAKMGNVECLRFLIKNGWIKNDCIENGWIKNDCIENDCIKKNCFLTNETIEYAAEYGQLDCLKLLYAYECPCDSNENGKALTYYRYVTTFATSNGHLDCLIWLHEHDYKWNSDLFKCALKHNQFDCFRYAYRQNCFLDYEDEMKAIQYGWLIQ